MQCGGSVLVQQLSSQQPAAQLGQDARVRRRGWARTIAVRCVDRKEASLLVVAATLLTECSPL